MAVILNKNIPIASNHGYEVFPMILTVDQTGIVSITT